MDQLSAAPPHHAASVAWPENSPTGVIEGFYGPPWSNRERAELFAWLRQTGLNTYIYAPKDDLHHRLQWREPYSSAAAEQLRKLIAGCQAQKVRFVYALGPGLDLSYTNERDPRCLIERLAQMFELGCQDFALCFDDIPDELDAAARKRWGSFAAAQAHVANGLWEWLKERATNPRFFFCPTAYCERMARCELGGKDYLEVLGRALAPEIDVFWTGPEIISRTITPVDIAGLRARLGRAPVLWDNLWANDYDGRRFYCGPCSGRPLDVRSEVRGWFINPNCEFAFNFVPIHTFGAFLHAPNTPDTPAPAWDPRAVYLRTMENWQAQFATVTQPIPAEDLVLLGDCFYLPYEEGPEAETLYQSARTLLRTSPSEWGDAFGEFEKRATRLRDCCARLAELRDRGLFHALSRRVWELREEMDLILAWTRARRAAPKGSTPIFSDSHLPGTYRGGFVPRLQHLLHQHADGSFTPSRDGMPDKP